MVKEKIQKLDSEEFKIKSISVNRGFISVTYDSELENDEIKNLFEDNLEDEQLFAINFKTDSRQNSDEMVDIVEFKVR